MVKLVTIIAYISTFSIWILLGTIIFITITPISMIIIISVIGFLVFVLLGIISFLTGYASQFRKINKRLHILRLNESDNPENYLQNYLDDLQRPFHD